MSELDNSLEIEICKIKNIISEQFYNNKSTESRMQIHLIIHASVSVDLSLICHGSMEVMTTIPLPDCWLEHKQCTELVQVFFFFQPQAHYTPSD